MSKKPLFLLIILACSLLFLNGCGEIQAPLQDDPDLEMFELDEIKIEAKIIDESLKDPKYILLLQIYRVGHILDPDVNWMQEDRLLLEVSGDKDGYLYGIAQNGVQTITGTNDDCIMTCTGKIGYRVKGVIFTDLDCEIKIWVTQYGKPASCTSSCLPPDMVFPWDSGVAEFVLNPIITDLESLSRGVTTEQEVGNYHWASEYTVISIAGKTKEEICDLKED